jgi:hypothetical protein
MFLFFIVFFINYCDSYDLILSFNINRFLLFSFLKKILEICLIELGSLSSITRFLTNKKGIWNSDINNFLK